MQSIGVVFFIIAFLAIHYTVAPMRKKRHKPYSINEWLLNPAPQQVDDGEKDPPSLLTALEIRSLLIDAKMKSKAEPTVDDHREEQ